MPLSETIFIIMALLTVAMIAAGFERRLPIPYTVILVIIGLLLSLLSEHINFLGVLGETHLTPDLVLFVFLPALVFESAFNLDARKLVQEILPVLALAIPALLISTALVGLGIWWSLGISPIVALLFGALISATDPVAVVSLFKELGAPQRLTVLVEGESLFNDATAIVIFHILLGLALSGNVHWSNAIFAVFEFLWVFFGGIMIGLLIGMIICELMWRLSLSGSGLIILSLVMAYTSFILAEHYLHVSGVMAVLTAALCLGYYGVSRLSKSDVGLLRETWEFLAMVFNSLLFLLVGLSEDAGALIENLDAILIAAILVLIARAVVLYPLVPMTTRLFSLPRVSLGERHVMWWGGLKGGLAIAIVLSIPFELPERQFLVHLTLGVVLFSLLINASTIRPLMARLGLSALSKDEQLELQRGLVDSEKNANGLLLRFSETGLLSAAAHQEIQTHFSEFIDSGSQTDQQIEQDARQVFLDALRIEFSELDKLNDIGLLPAWAYLDLRNTLQRDREYWMAWTDGDPLVPTGQAKNLFERIEQTVLGRLREHDWAADFLSRYQSHRLGHRLHHDIASILMCEAVLAKFQKHHDRNEFQSLVIEVYQTRLERRRNRLTDVESEFPTFYQRFETRLFERAALLSARKHLEHLSHGGQIGAKALNRISRNIEAALQTLPEQQNAVRELNAAELIQSVPLFAELSESVLEKLSKHAAQVTFLPKDVVIAEGEKGDALYIVIRGRVQILRRDQQGQHQKIAELDNGAFFGETALLGDHVRTATASALVPLTLLRLRQRDVLKLMKKDPEVASQLRAAFESRGLQAETIVNLDEKPNDNAIT